MKVTSLSDFAKSSGRKDLTSFAIGVIKMVARDCSYTDAEKVQEIKETLSSLEQVRNDDSLPWNYEDAQKADALTPAQDKFQQLQFTTLDAVMEGIPVPWTIDDLPNWTPENIQRNEA